MAVDLSDVDMFSGQGQTIFGVCSADSLCAIGDAHLSRSLQGRCSSPSPRVETNISPLGMGFHLSIDLFYRFLTFRVYLRTFHLACFEFFNENLSQ